ncbi:doublesex- and mab-3-related transcription factor C1-like [Castor canadensis]|uniref:Doublesex- and mab-3-related transcription factor C1-like n=2 Tax=Castor canadensis TaxID=51338 RepID=A0AC58LMH8_CASCN
MTKEKDALAGAATIFLLNAGVLGARSRLQVPESQNRDAPVIKRRKYTCRSSQRPFVHTWMTQRHCGAAPARSHSSGRPGRRRLRPLPSAARVWSSGSEGGGLRLETLGLRVSSAAAAAFAATSLCSRPRTQRCGRPPNARGRASLPRVPASWASQSRREHYRALPAVSGFKREQGAELKRDLAQGPIKTMAAAPKSHVHVKRLAIETGVLTGKENTVSQPVAHTGMSPQEESPQGPLLLNHLPEPSSQPCPPPTSEQQLTVPLSRERRGASALLSICSSLFLQPCAIPDPLLLQPQVPYDQVSQASVSASLEWQRKLEAAEALLALKNSSQAPPNSISLHQPLNPPGPAGDRGPQTPSPCPESRPPGSVTLPVGHLGCISLLS